LPKTEETDKQALLTLISPHITSLIHEFRFYFGDLNVGNNSWIADPFTVTIEEVDLPPLQMDQLVNSSHDSTSRAKHRGCSLDQFWVETSRKYPNLADSAFHVLLPVATTYRSESGFSALTAMKTKHRSRLNVEDDLRLCLSQATPWIDKLCADMQAQGSH